MAAVWTSARTGGWLRCCCYHAAMDAWRERAWSRWPGLELGPAFIEHVGGLCDALGQPPRHLEDLALAFALGNSSPVAIALFEAQFVPELTGAIAKRCAPQIEVDEVIQAVRTRLLVGEAPKILSYRGQGPLAGWLRIVGLRVLSDAQGLQRRTRVAQLGPDDVLGHLVHPRDLAASVASAQHRKLVSHAIRSSLAALPGADRLLVQQRFIHGLAVREIAELQGVHRVTISKRLARIRARVRRELAQALRDALDTDEHEAMSLARACLSQLSISLGRVTSSST